jgi:hypothetical protein
MAEAKRVLVLANRTAESPELLDALRRRAEESAAEFTLLVPASAHGVAWAANMYADVDTGGEEARGHLEALAERLRGEGLDLKEAKVGDPDPLAAAQDEVNTTSYDELIVSTLPLRVSRWLKVDLPHKAGHATGLPVTHVVAHSADSS